MKSETLINTAIIIFVVIVVVIVFAVVVRTYVLKYKNRKQKVLNAQGQEQVEMIKKANNEEK
jgi:flagellar biosynthesis/type III secretory pathway M-ring protein FliF/YscJ